MSEQNAINSLEEQGVCVTCGLCCDGTLFTTALLHAGEYPDIPEKIRDRYEKKEDREYFRLPCPYFCEKCTIYDQPKPRICSEFRCKLLHKLSEKELSQQSAITAVARANKIREEVYELYFTIFGVNYPKSFRELLSDLPAILETSKSDKSKKEAVDLLIMKCGLLDTLLIKTFRPDEKFNELLKNETMK